MLERVTVVRRELPAIPLTTTTTTTTTVDPEQQQQQQQQQESSVWFDSGHYTDIHFNVVGGAAASIPTWRRSIVDDPDHYSYPELGSARLQRSRSSGRDSYEVPGTASSQQAAAAPGLYTGITASSSTDRHGDVRPAMQLPASGDVVGQPHQRPDLGPSRPQDDTQRQRQGHEGRDPTAVERLGRTRRRHSYAGAGSDMAAVVHDYLELIEYSAGSHYDTAITAVREGVDSGREVGGLGTRRPHSYAGVQQVFNAVADRFSGSNGQRDCGSTSRGYEGLDPAAVEEMRIRTRRPHLYAGVGTSAGAVAGITGRSGSNGQRDGGSTSRGYEGLDPAAVEELRLRSTRPAAYAGLSGLSQGEVVAVSAGYAGLDRVEVEEARRPAGRPSQYEELRNST